MCFLPLSARGVLMKNSWSPITEEIVLLGRMKIIVGSLWLQWLNVTCDTFNVLTVEQRRTTGLEKEWTPFDWQIPWHSTCLLVITKQSSSGVQVRHIGAWVKKVQKIKFCTYKNKIFVLTKGVPTIQTEIHTGFSLLLLHKAVLYSRVPNFVQLNLLDFELS